MYGATAIDINEIGSDGNPEREMLVREQAAIYREGMALLNDRNRRIHMLFLYGYSMNYIARVFGLTPNAVQKRHNRSWAVIAEHVRCRFEEHQTGKNPGD
ncbi:MAG: sigma-70 family RNA polymerase sigma factor [Deltaproteobacteria bacterium]|nr:sigma-70 family RNA polymerase sigma factor [Candidatus Zymogenaceae bacterium]